MPSEKKGWELPGNARTAFKGEISAKIKVLCVDDNAFLLYLTRILLENEDDRFVVETATSTADALHKMAGEAFDAVVCDFIMPEMDGLEFLEQLRSKGNTIPFIMLTGDNREDIAARAKNLGVKHFIEKSTNLKSHFNGLTQAIISEIERNGTVLAPKL
ncbi:MAG: response regulator [Candidatus Thorarchaeota archaeon]